MHTATLATAAAYVRVNTATGLADLVCGAQVEYVLTQLHTDAQVRPAPSGVYHVTGDAALIEYRPLAPGAVPHADHYTFTTSPDGRTRQPRGVVTDAEMRRRLHTARGRVHTLADGSLISLYRGRLAAVWTPLPKPTTQECR